MAEDIIYITTNHPLVGVWQGSEDDARAQYTIKPSKNGFEVSAVDIYDGEEFEISNVEWNGECLMFNSFMKSTERHGKNSFRVKSTDEIEVTFTFTETYLWRRVDEE